MSNFSMKPQAQQNSNQSEGGESKGYSSWNELEYNLIDGKEYPATKKDGSVREGVVFKKKKMVGKLAMIVDVGLQPQQDSSYASKCKVHGTEDGTVDDAATGLIREGYSEEEKAHVAKFKTNYYVTVDGKRMQFKPERPAQEYAFYFDFEKAQVDWSQHPNENVHELGVKPLRVCYNGHFQYKAKGIDGFSRNLRFEPHWQTKLISPNNPVYKMAIAMGLQDEFEKEYDFGTLVEGACFFDVIIEKTVRDGKTYINTEIKNFSEIVDIEAGDTTITRGQQIPESTQPFVGVHLDAPVDSYDKLTLDIVSSRMYNKELKAVLPRATSFQPNAVKAPDFWLGTAWGDTGLCKALLAHKNPSDAPAESNTPTPKQTPKVEEKVVKVASQEPEIVFDDDVPF